MLELGVLDSFLKLVSYLVQLVKAGHEGRRLIFEEIVTPLFNSLEPVVDDYLRLFRHAEAALAAADPNTTALEELRSHRHRLLHARVKVREMADAICVNCEDEDLQEFATAVRKLFYCTRIATVKQGSVAEKLVDLLDLLEQDEVPIEQLRDFVKGTLHNLIDAWGKVANLYASLRIASIA